MAGMASIDQNQGLRHNPVDCAFKNQYSAIKSKPTLYNDLESTKPPKRQMMAVYAHKSIGLDGVKRGFITMWFMILKRVKPHFRYDWYAETYPLVAF